MFNFREKYRLAGGVALVSGRRIAWKHGENSGSRSASAAPGYVRFGIVPCVRLLCWSRVPFCVAWLKLLAEGVWGGCVFSPPCVRGL